MTAHPTPLQAKLASQIISHARLSGWHSGHHLTEDSLQPILGASRTPIRAAMAQLVKVGVLEKVPNKGFFLKDAFATRDEAVESSEGEVDVYQTIALDRLNGSLRDTVSENELIRRYDLSRARLRHVLARIAAEGWIERRPGRGWVFQPLIDTLDAYRENYRFREMLEPAAMRSSDFKIDIEKLAFLQTQQVFVESHGYTALSQVELFEINSSFHESLAQMSHNRFIVGTLTKLNNLRRLVEYGRPVDRSRTRLICREHLAIIDDLFRGNIVGAAQKLEQHLSVAATEKTEGWKPS